MISDRQQLDADYVLKVHKLPKSRAINVDNSPTMEKLKLKLMTQVKVILKVDGSQCIFLGGL